MLFFCALILMTKTALTDIRMMCWHSFLFVEIGMSHVALSVQGLEMERMYGSSSLMRFQLLKVRRFGNIILTEAMKRNGRISFDSYDRFFPNQDRIPEGGFGNLIALPLQGGARKVGNSVFVDDKISSIQRPMGIFVQCQEN